MQTTNGYCDGPFGAPAILVKVLPVSELVEGYRAKCAYDASRHFQGLDSIQLYECSKTGIQFWRPATVAGDECFYADISRLWPDYYKTDRWEYALAREALGSSPKKVLEVGCGRGYFLKSLEPLDHAGSGLELNRDAIANKVTRFSVRASMHTPSPMQTVSMRCVPFKYWSTLPNLEASCVMPFAFWLGTVS